MEYKTAQEELQIQIDNFKKLAQSLIKEADWYTKHNQMNTIASINFELIYRNYFKKFMKKSI